VSHALPSLSIVVEMENIRTVEPAVLGIVLDSLAAQLWPVMGRLARPPRLIFVHPGKVEANDEVLARIRQDGPSLRSLDIHAVAVPDGRYYEMKNAGAALAENEILIFADSDAPPEGDWLLQLLAAFEDPETVAASGRTFLKHDDFLSRTLALTWIFPLEHGDEQEARQAFIWANNVAFRRDWFADAGGFPYDMGFKCSCSLLDQRLLDAGKTCIRVNARARHEPLRGLRFVAWRAGVTGRDDDRKYLLRKSGRRLKRVRYAIKRWNAMMWRTTRKVVTKRKLVNMPAREVPFALLLGWTFYTIAFANQLGRATGLSTEKVERIPEIFEPQ